MNMQPLCLWPLFCDVDVSFLRAQGSSFGDFESTGEDAGARQTSEACVSKEVEVEVAGTRFCVLMAVFSGVRVVIGQHRDQGGEASAGWIGE
jgi:hypothetical protein